jgi:hypothetical protein
MDSIENFLTCPISKMILCEPVIAEDGYIYEKQSITEWFNMKNTSPMTNLQITDNLIPITSLKCIIDEYLITNPDKI